MQMIRALQIALAAAVGGSVRAVCAVVKISKSLQMSLKRLQATADCGIYQTKTIVMHAAVDGVFWSVNRNLTYLERRAEESNLDGAQTGRHIVIAVELCNVIGVRMQTGWIWLLFTTPNSHPRHCS